MSASCSPLDEARPAPLWEADVDDIEVPRHDRLGKDGAGLARDLGPEVAVREVREGEHAHVRRPRELRDLCRGRVQRLVGTLLLLGREGRFVHEQVGALRGFEHHPSRPRVSSDHHLAARPRRAEHLGGLHLGPAGARDGLACLEAAEERPLGHAEGPGGLDVEAAGPLGLEESVPIRIHPVLDLEGADPVVAAAELVAGP